MRLHPRTLRRLVGVARSVVGLGAALGMLACPAAAVVAVVTALAMQPALYYVLAIAVLASAGAAVVAAACSAADTSLIHCEIRLRRW